MEFREKLVQLRKEKGLSQMQVAEALDVSRQAISKWEVGDAEPSTANLIALAALYGVSLDYLVGNSNVRNLAEGGEAPPPVAEGEKKSLSWRKRWISIAVAVCFVVGTMIWGKLTHSPAAATLLIVDTTIVVGVVNLYWEIIKFLRRK